VDDTQPKVVLEEPVVLFRASWEALSCHWNKRSMIHWKQWCQGI